MSEQSGAAGSRYLPTNAIETQLGFLQGEILTLADSSLADKEQCKAFKDLVKQFFRSRIRYIGSLAYGIDDRACGNTMVNHPIYTTDEAPKT